MFYEEYGHLDFAYTLERECTEAHSMVIGNKSQGSGPFGEVIIRRRWQETVVVELVVQLKACQIWLLGPCFCFFF